MAIHLLRCAAVTAVCGLALAGSAVPAMAASAPGIGPATDLALALHEGETTSGAVLAEVTLLCDPAGGTHPRASAACDSLSKVDGNFAELPPVVGAVCLNIYDPVTAVANGAYRGRPVEFVRTYSNRCDAGSSTDNVFKF